MQDGVSVEIHSACASKEGERGSIAENISTEMPAVCCQHFSVCIMHSLDIQCTKKAAKIRKV